MKGIRTFQRDFPVGRATRRLLVRRNPSRIFFGALVVVSALFSPICTSSGLAQNTKRGVTAEEVEQAVDSAVQYLLNKQLLNDGGGWPEFSVGHRYELGVSSLVTLALLNAGLEPEHPRMVKALNYISSKELEHVYTVSLQTMALCTANPNKYAALIRRNAEWLIRAQQTGKRIDDPRALGGWAYDESPSYPDESNSQFALLALHEAQRSGVANFSRETWTRVFERSLGYWERVQRANGGFGYRNGPGERGSMTCAGIASLVIAGSQTRGGESSAGQAIACCGQEDSTNDRIERALEWLGSRFSVRSNPGQVSHYYYYYMYALERVGRLTGRRFIGKQGKHDWYREGAEFLIKVKQKRVGGGFVTSRQQDGNDCTDAAFALLFLSKGKRKIVVSRLQYPSADGDDWNHHSAAIQHLTAHTEQVWKQTLAWQTIDIEGSSLEDLLESPVLFISGTKAPRFSNQQKLLLKEYVKSGGFIFAEGCRGNGCNGEAFEEYFRKLVLELWDKPLEPLPPDHPIWYAEGKVQPEGLPSGDANVYGVQTCCRLGVVYVPYSLSCRWELNVPYGIKPNFNERVKLDLDTATLLGVNVLSYATGKELKDKLDTVTILEDVESGAPTDRNIFLLPKLQHNAGYDDANRAIPNLVQWLNNTYPFRMSSERKVLPITKENLRQHAVAYMHGRGELILSTAEREALEEFFENDGFLFADAICADEEFTESFRREMEIILGEELVTATPSHPMYSDKYDGMVPIRDLRIIDPTQAGDTLTAATRRITPRMEIAKKNGRVVVAFSPLDLSCALESKHSLQCKGYFREDAAKLGINVLLFALQQ